ncbi:MAG: beta-ketoacyl synthase N-terminal-like domain-containing protein [Rhizonema sp. PD38]|nr:beta-ketoacyl synthase N-terminal-like domain-containing protein [Rhizonema sp. PD38]
MMNANNNSTDNRALLTKALVKLEKLQAKVNTLENEKSEAIAIIGMGCRFPGGANDLESFWQVLRDGVDTTTEIPPDRWNIDTFYDPDPNTVGKIYTRNACFLEQVDQFDASFFGISAREAVMLDPQQRLLLEVSWESLECAGLAPEKLRDSQTGVFVGVMTQDYTQVVGSEPNNADIHTATGLGLCAGAGRLAYFLGLHGPTLTIETACSSSLVSVHLACQSLRLKECSLALACGVNLILHPYMSVIESRARMLSPDGRCKTFDASANGMGRGEGCGAIVLKRLSDAIADNDNILGLIRGSAVNQDGRSSALTVPNGVAQKKLIRQALAASNIDAADIDYVEAHGTGTSLGDPIEVEALGEVFGSNHTQERPLLIGSVKTNIGHQEGAAGIAGLLKVLLALQKEEIPPHIHFQKPNPRIAWEKLPIKIPVEPTPWRQGEKSRFAGVSAFSLVGTNAHVVLEEAPTFPDTTANITEPPFHLLTLSAKTPETLKQLAERYQFHLEAYPQQSFADVCFTANTGRSHFPYRLSIVAASATQAREQLVAWVAGETDIHGIYDKQSPAAVAKPKVAFLFGGQDSQYLGMGQELYETQSVFRATFDHCEEILHPYFNVSLFELLWGKSSYLLNEYIYIQPSLFALEYSLYQLWLSWGIQPDAVFGDDMGEYVAACVAGVFSLEDGLKLMVAHARYMQSLPLINPLATNFTETSPLLVFSHTESSAVSTDNISHSLTRGYSINTVYKLPIAQKQAFSPALLEPLLAEFEAVAREINYHLPCISLIANRNGQLVDQQIATPEYWLNQLGESLQLDASIQTLHRLRYELFVEVSPGSTLLQKIQQRSLKAKRVCLPSLSSTNSEWQTLLTSLANLYIYGFKVDWSALYSNYCRRKVILPTYPWQREHYWIETTANDSQLKNSSQVVETPIIRLLNQGNTEELAQELKKVSTFSPEQIVLLPEVQFVLVQQHQKHLPEIANQFLVADASMEQESKILENLERAANRDEILKLLTNYVLQQITKVVKFDANKTIESEQSLIDLGIDSMMLLEINSLIQKDLKVSVSLETFLENANIIQIAEELTNKVMEQYAWC